jgi:uncharacterized alkaline shock family protein YloU
VNSSPDLSSVAAPGSSQPQATQEQSKQQGRTSQLAERSQAAGSVALETEQGSTRISGGVVAKIAGLAARDIPGVFSMGSSMARRVGQLKSLIPGSGEAADQGVNVEVGEREAAIDLNIVTWYGQSIVDVSDAVRRNVIGQVEGMTGLRVVEVNIQVDDIQVETPQDTQKTETRVQ